MKKNSCIALGASLLLFLAAGTVKFWPQERFLTPPSFFNGGFGNGFSGGMGNGSPSRLSGSSNGLFPMSGSFMPGRDSAVRDDRTASALRMSNPAAPRLTPNQAALPAPDHKAGEPRNGISLVAQNMPVGDILAQLFHKAGVAYSFTGRWNETMTITFDGATLDQALGQTLSLTTRPRLTCRKENGVYVVTPFPQFAPQALEMVPPAQSLSSPSLR